MPVFELKSFQHPRETDFNTQFVYKSLCERSFSTHLAHGTLYSPLEERNRPGTVQPTGVCNSRVSQRSMYQFISLLHPHKLF